MIKKQRGVTMIELLIAMVLGLSLVAGIGQLFVQSQKSFRLQRNLSDMTDDATFVLEDFAKGLMTAGYSLTGTNFDCYKQDKCFTDSDPSLKVAETQTNVLSSGLDLTCFDSETRRICETIKGTDNEIVYRFKLDATESHENNSICIVDSYKAQEIVPVYVLHDNTSKEMSCTSKSNAQPMAAEVEKLEFRYGVRVKCYENIDTKACEKVAKNGVNQYKSEKDTFFYTTASEVDKVDPDTSLNNWTNVFAVKVFLVMRSAENNVVKTSIKYKIENDEYTAPDNRIYKVFTKTVFLRTSEK